MTSEQKKTLQVYGVLIVAIILNFLPGVFIQTVGAFMALAAIIAAYVVRKKADKDSLAENHMTFVIRSFWISSLFLAIGITASVVLADHSLIHNMYDDISQGAFYSESQINAIMHEYARTNFIVFTMAFAPAILYLVYRLIKGAVKARKYENIENVKSWL